MAGAPRTLRFQSAAEPGAVRALRHDLERFLDGLGVNAATCFDIKLAVTEAANNVLQHAYRERRASGPLRVDAWVRGGHVVVTIADEGGGPAPRPDSPGAGFGMPLMATLSDDVTVRHGDGGGTHVELAFRLGEGAA